MSFKVATYETIEGNIKGFSHEFSTFADFETWLDVKHENTKILRISERGKAERIEELNDLKEKAKKHFGIG